MNVTKRVAITFGTGILLGGLSLGAVAGAAGASPSGQIKLWAVSTTVSGSGGRVVVTGAIGDYGTTQKVNSSGKPSANGNCTKLVLRQGTILLNTTQVNNAANSTQPEVNISTCSVSSSITGSAPIVSGTGAYSGVKGSLSVTGAVGAILQRRNGRCNTGQSARPVSGIAVISASGTVSG